MNQRSFVLSTLVLCGALGTPGLVRAGSLQMQDDVNKGPGYTIVGARVYDGERWLPPGTQVRVQHGLVLAVGPDVGLPRGGTLIDGTGKTLLPETASADTGQATDAKAGCPHSGHGAIVTGAQADLRLVNGDAGQDWSGLGDIVARWKSGVLVGHHNNMATKPL